MEKLYSNENFSKSVVLHLRQLGYDVLTSFEAGKANQGIPDPEVLAFAISQERTLITINRRDFIKLHFANSEHFGIIVCTKDDNFKALAQRIDQILIENRGDCACKLLRVYKPAI
jgi:predicted nuclease of predicted toxin-antitoxin system